MKLQSETVPSLHTVDRKISNCNATVRDGLPTSADLSWLWGADPPEEGLE